jgi:hypothetical protein
MIIKTKLKWFLDPIPHFPPYFREIVLIVRKEAESDDITHRSESRASIILH